MSATDREQEQTHTTLLAGGGEMGALMRAIDWAQTPLGPIEDWPQSLRTSVSVCLHSRFPILLWWGPELVMLYNDAYRPMLGTTKHPQAMGRAGREVWPEIWQIIGPMLDGVLARGEATWSDDQLLLLDRNGYVEECYFTFSYSPIHDETGKVGGIFCAVTETTERVLGERRLKTLRDLGESSLLEAQTAEHACRAAAATLAENARDFPFGLIYLLDADRRQARLVGSANLAAGAHASPTLVSLGTADDVWNFDHIATTHQSLVVDGLSARFGNLPAGPWDAKTTEHALVLPLAKTGVQDTPAGFLITGISPCLALTDAYRSFLELAAQQLATAIANARAYEEERKRAEALAELDRAKTTFFSNISHEFRTPLTLILGPLEDLRQQLDGTLPPAEREQLDVAHRNTLRLLKLVNTLLDFSRIEAGRIEATYAPTDLAAFTAELASLFRSAIERAGLTLKLDCPPLAEPAYVDRDMWEKIVFNLLSNAFKFTFAGQIIVSLRPRGDWIELTIGDTGIGIPAAELPHLFERFHRVASAQGRSSEGTGIGLALVQELARLHGGTVRVESELGGGSTFVVALPRGHAHLPAERIGATRALASTALRSEAYVEDALRWLPAPGGGGWGLGVGEQESMRQPDLRSPTSQPLILLADDNADMREYVRRLLSPYYLVQVVPNGAAALAAAREQIPDLLLADVMMPELDGFGLLRALRADERTRGVPLILLSARAGEEARLEGLAAGADDYLVKPFSARELLARVEARLELARIRQEALVRQQALEISESRLRMAVEAGAIGIWDIDLRSGARIWSDEGKAIYGLAPHEELDYERQLALIHPDDRARVHALVTAFRDEGTLKQLTCEHRIVRPDSTLRWVAVRGEAIYDREALPVRLIGTVIDITERKQAEQRLQRLQEVTTRFAAAQSLDEVRTIMLGQVLAALGADSGGLRRVTQDALVVDELELGQHVNLEIARRYAHVPLTALHPAAEAARSGRAVFARDAGEIIERYPDLAATVAQQRTQATAQLPLKRGEEVFGVLSMNFAAPRAWDDAEQAFALALADRAAIAYERARLFEAEQQIRKTAERTTERLAQLQHITAALGAVLTREQVADTIVQEVKRAMNAPAGIVFVLSQDATALEQLTSAGYRDAITKAAVRIPLNSGLPIADCVTTGQSMFVESQAEYAARYPARQGIAEREGFAAFIAIPLQLDARIVGALGITFLTPRTFSAEDRAFVEALAWQCAQALERARLYEALRESEARYRELADSMPQLVWTSNPDGVVDYYNSRVAEYAGIVRTGAATWNWQPVLHPDDLGPTLAAWGEASRSGQPYAFEHRIQMKDGSFRWHLSRAMPAHDRDGQIVKWFGTATDIHDHHQAAEDAHCLADIGEIIRLTANAETMLRRVTQIVGDYLQVRRCMIIEIDLAHDLGVILHQHCRGVPPVAAQYRLTTYSEVAQVEIDTGRTIVNLDSQTDPRTAAIYEATYRPHGERAYVAVPLMRDGVRNGTLWVSDDVPRRWQAREVWLLETVAERVWLALEKLRAEQALRANEERLQVLYAQEQAARAQAEAASRLKDEFLATVSHELRTPLTSILGYGQIIQTRKRDEAYIARTIDKIVSSAKAQAQLIDDLLDVARIVTGKLRVEPRLIDMAPVIQAAVEALRPAIDAKGLRLAIDLDSEASTIVGDPNRLQQVVWNLVSNAVKFTPSGGTVRVQFETDERHAQLTVSDTGQGIAPEFLPYVFDRFRQAESTSTRAHGGLGLGLAIVRHLVEMHGGTVQVESAGIGQGATFTVRLPIAAGEPATAPQYAPEAADSARRCPPELAGLRVLVVDDQPDIAELVHDMLAPCGVVIRTATAARDALATLRTWQPDVLVSDVAMPGEDGYWLIRNVRALGPEQGGGTPAVALTAYVRVEDRLQVLAAGFQLYVPKPVEPAELLDAVARLARARATGES